MSLARARTLGRPPALGDGATTVSHAGEAELDLERRVLAVRQRPGRWNGLPVDGHGSFHVLDRHASSDLPSVVSLVSVAA